MSKWKRRLCWLGAFVVVAGVYVWLFGVHNMRGNRINARGASEGVAILAGHLQE